MASWNQQYKSNPPDDNNPGYGAAAIRDLKTNIEGVVGNEHNFSLIDLGVQGQHYPGSAIIDLAEDTSTKVNNLQAGRLKGSTDADSKTTLQVKGVTEDLNIEGYNQVSKSGDETIAGTKTFTTAPAITQIVDDESSDTTIANVGYVKFKNDTTEINPIENNASPVSDLAISDFNSNLIYTILNDEDTNNLEELLVQIVEQLGELRATVNALALNNPFSQDLTTTGSPTFTGVTATGNISANKVYGAVWN